MKLMIASDLHGSAAYTRRLMAAFSQEMPDKLVLLGDLLYHGPRNDLPLEYDPKAVIAMLNPLKEQLLCVRGNCDAEVDQMVLDFPIMADYAMLSVDDMTLCATHGHVYSPDHLPPMAAGGVLLSGHTHVPLCEKQGNTLCLNPGSVSIPKNDSPHGYILYENRTFCWKTLEGETWQTHSL